MTFNEPLYQQKRPFCRAFCPNIWPDRDFDIYYQMLVMHNVGYPTGWIFNTSLPEFQNKTACPLYGVPIQDPLLRRIEGAHLIPPASILPGHIPSSNRYSFFSYTLGLYQSRELYASME